MIDRRKFLRAALFVAAAPVIVRASSLMPVRALPSELNEEALKWAIIQISTFALRESLQHTKWAIADRILSAGGSLA